MPLTHLEKAGRHREALEKVAAATDAIPYAADVTSLQAVEQLVAKVEFEHGRLDGVVANGGDAPGPAPSNRRCGRG
ncbi:SDR family oxidoreductase [Streptomyces sp. NBC_00878]|uniref:SDR family oxidoreductase n=1 Tax=Streptomyces sp. NBC_00878 TaxID=2975854 RepID=UPI00225012A3|nr:SDR family oxidoreductase [Streptomyces sp. NBC_00878]MCX4906319.1 SDR family oxidoreductase [Streptomyces sp. NBC_00878]